jgi:membrane-bound lytic murein transglycosylase F
LWWQDFPRPDYWHAQLVQESLCRLDAVSPAGAEGIAQFMPPTWAEVRDELGWPEAASPFDAIAIEAGAYYMRRQRRVFEARPRSVLERHRLAMAAYNAGLGRVLRAQRRCGNALTFDGLKACLPGETRAYVPAIEARVQRLNAENAVAR